MAKRYLLYFNAFRGIAGKCRDVMRCLVVYFSRGGKTAKVAAAIAQELGCEAIDAANKIPDASGVDVLVAGSGTYGGMPGPKIVEFLNSLPEKKGGKAAIFTTSAGPRPLSIGRMKGALEGKGYEVVASFDCRGRFGLINRGNPDEGDLEKAREFARSLGSR